MNLKLDDYEIKTDAYNWILFKKPRTFWYYATLEDLLADVFNQRLKKKEVKSLEDISKAIADVKTSLTDEIKHLDLSRLDSAYRPEVVEGEEV